MFRSALTRHCAAGTHKVAVGSRAAASARRRARMTGKLLHDSATPLSSLPPFLTERSPQQQQQPQQQQPEQPQRRQQLFADAAPQENSAMKPLLCNEFCMPACPPSATSRQEAVRVWEASAW